jgi:hypothetical protein
MRGYAMANLVIENEETQAGNLYARRVVICPGEAGDHREVDLKMPRQE